MRSDPAVGREVAIACAVAKAVALLLPLFQIILTLRAGFTGPLRADILSYFARLITPIAAGVALYLLALLVLALSRRAAR
jgi:hypothetical protein